MADPRRRRYSNSDIQELANAVNDVRFFLGDVGRVARGGINQVRDIGQEAYAELTNQPTPSRLDQEEQRLQAELNRLTAINQKRKRIEELRGQIEQQEGELEESEEEAYA